MNNKQITVTGRIVKILVLFCIFGSATIAEGKYPGRVNERFSLRAMRTLHSAEMTYAATFGNGNYGTAADLGQVNFIDPALATGSKFGYIFAVTFTHASATLAANFVVSATPQRYGKTGRKSYFIDSSGYIHGADKGGQSANANDPIIDDCTSGAIIENERCTKYSMRSLTTAQNTFSATYGNGNYATLAELAATGWIDPALASGEMRGYAFTIAVAPANGQTQASFHIDAVPTEYGMTGTLSFYIDQTGVIRGADKQGGPAGPNDPPVAY